MIGVIVLSGPSEKMHGLDSQRSPSLLPLGDRPAIQHIVESMVSQGITTMELIVGHAPEGVEALLGNGDRWGCRFQYHLVGQPDRPYRSLRIIPALASEPWVLVHADRYPCVEFQAAPTETALYFGDFAAESGQPPSWGGTAAFPASGISEEFANYTASELQSYIDSLAASGAATTLHPTEWLDVSSPARLLESQSRLLDKKLPGLLLSGTEREPGIWISRNVTCHPTVQFTAPVYIGPNTRLSRGVRVGPCAVIGADCIIDTNTLVEQALIMEGSYVGEALEVSHAIVAQNLLVNVRLDASVDVTEGFLLDRLDRPNRHRWASSFVQATIAAVLFLLFLPITLISSLVFWLRKLKFTTLDIVSLPIEDDGPSARTYKLRRVGDTANQSSRAAGWSAFTRQFLPGLPAVVCGHLDLVGLPPRTITQLRSLSSDWRAIYHAGRAGLITERSVAVSDPNDEMQLYLADAYYAVQNSTRHDLSLAMKYFSRLVVPHRTPQSTTPAPPPFPAETTSIEAD